MSVNFDKIANEVINELEGSLKDISPKSDDLVDIEELKKAILRISTMACCKLLEKCDKSTI